MSKDPAFLFYSKDWLQGTAQLMPDEKGVYIDLLAHQHQDNDLPNDIKRLARIVGMAEKDFLPIWEVLKVKFVNSGNNRLVNRKLTEISTERSTKGLRNRISGTFASIIRLSTEPYEKKAEIKKLFNIDDFITVPDHLLTESITEWFLLRLKSIEDGNANTSEDGNTINTTLGEKFLIPEMFKVFKTHLPNYAAYVDKDFKPLKSVADFIHSQSGLNGNIITNQKVIIEEWGKMCAVIAEEKFYKTKSLSTISNQIQEIYQITKHGTGKNKQVAGTNKFNAGATELLNRVKGQASSK